MTYCPPHKRIIGLPSNNFYLLAAKEFALAKAKDPKYKLGAVLVKDGRILGFGANGTDYHIKHGCRRQELGIPTGEQHELCPGCNPAYHAEQDAINNALKEHSVKYITGFDLYMYGHWHCCISCWNKMLIAGVNQVYVDNDILEMGLTGKF